ncbi:MAG: hypothetical protein ACRYFU_26790 [Janthinobacterium lividum]
MKQLKRIVSSAALVGVALSLPAQTLKDKSGMEADRKQMMDSQKSVNSTCGTSIQVKVDYDSYIKGAGSVDEYSHAPYQYCQNATEALEQTCRNSSAGKQAVQQKVKALSCSYGATQGVSLDGSTLHYTVGYHGGNADFVVKWLGDHL